MKKWSAAMKDRRAGHPLNIAAALDVLKPIAWIALVSLVALASRAIGNDGLLLGGLWLALLIRHGLLQSPDAVQLEPVEGLRHLSPSKVYE